MIRASDKRLILDFEELVDVVRSTTSVNRHESAGDKRKRVELLLGNYQQFCEYYFPEYCFAPMAWFHKEYMPEIANNPNAIYLLQWSREFAKSTHGALFLPLYLKAKGELTGMILGSHDETMAGEKLIDLQANLEGNQRYINDFGEQKTYGDWAEGMFKTKDDVPFYGFGKRQSPRGYKFKWKRPNFGAVDDLNDKRQLKNDDIATEDKDWVLEELKPALWIKKWWLVILQNKFHDNTITGLLEHDENIKARVMRANMEDENGNSNWPENFTNADCQTLRDSEGNAYERERMNNPIEDGTWFTADMLDHWTKPLPLHKYDSCLVHYLDPSYTAKSTSDYKFWVLLAKTGLYYDVLHAWGERTDGKTMWEHAYTINEMVGEKATVKHAMEANFIQEDYHKAELIRTEKEHGEALRIFMDKRDKGPKFDRIASMASLFKRGFIRFSMEQKQHPGMKLLRKQLLAFGEGAKVNDDGPDALESAIWFVDKHGKAERTKPRGGKLNKNKRRGM